MILPRRAATTFAALALIFTMTAASGGCGSQSNGARAASTGSCAVVKAGTTIVNCCKVATSYPKAGYPSRGLVGGIVRVTCSQTPDEMWLSTFLYWEGESEIDMDECSKYTPSTCTLAASCKPGRWSIEWILSVNIDGASAEESDKTTYHSEISEDDCEKTAA